MCPLASSASSSQLSGEKASVFRKVTLQEVCDAASWTIRRTLLNERISGLNSTDVPFWTSDRIFSKFGFIVFSDLIRCKGMITLSGLIVIFCEASP